MLIKAMGLKYIPLLFTEPIQIVIYKIKKIKFHLFAMLNSISKHYITIKLNKELKSFIRKRTKNK